MTVLCSLKLSVSVLQPVRKDVLDDGHGFTLAEQADNCGFLHPVIYYFERTDDLSKHNTVSVA